MLCGMTLASLGPANQRRQEKHYLIKRVLLFSSPFTLDVHENVTARSRDASREKRLHAHIKDKRTCTAEVLSHELARHQRRWDFRVVWIADREDGETFGPMVTRVAPDDEVFRHHDRYHAKLLLCYVCTPQPCLLVCCACSGAIGTIRSVKMHGQRIIVFIERRHLRL